MESLFLKEPKNGGQFLLTICLYTDLKFKNFPPRNPEKIEPYP